MKSCLLVITTLGFILTSKAQSFNYEMLGTDSVEFLVKIDSAIKATPDFGYTFVDTAVLAMEIFKPETLAKLTEEIQDALDNYDPYNHISIHLEGGWEVAASSDEDDYYLIKPFRGDKFWVKQLSKTYNDVYYKSSLILFKIDCKEGMLGEVQATEYDANGTIIHNSPTKKDLIIRMSYAIPDSVGEALIEIACQ